MTGDVTHSDTLEFFRAGKDAELDENTLSVINDSSSQLIIDYYWRRTYFGVVYLLFWYTLFGIFLALEVAS